MSIQRDLDLHLTRRQLFGLTARGIGVAALGSLLGSNVLTASQSPAARNAKTGGLTSLPHFTPKAKRVIFLHQSGGPSQLETFDYKPALAKYQGTQIPDSVRQGQRVAQTMGQSLLPVADRVAFGFDGPAASSTKQALVTGNPVRAEIEAIAPPAARFAGRSGPLRLLVVGGSLGAQALNGTLPQALAGDHPHPIGETVR